jgi:putative phosphoserine phosphatase/1-acylglycerol-3-phosphate O-acyltransferase
VAVSLTPAALDDAVRRVHTGPQGPAVGAFFDFDGTLVHGFSGVHFFRKVHRRGLSGRELAATLLAGIRGEKTDADVQAFIAMGLRAWRGHSEEELDEIGARLFASTIAGHLYPEAWRLIRAHEEAGHTLVIASSASRFQVEPAAAELGIEHVLCTRMEVAENGTLTGQVAGRMLWREGKAEAIRQFAGQHGVDLAHSYGYSNGGEDEAFLSLVGLPTAVNPDHRLVSVAVRREWPILRLRPRGPAGPVRMLRTAAGFGAIIAGTAAGVLSAAPTRDRELAASRLLTWGTAATLAAVGVRVNVVGDAEAGRPAVFIFNHQSQFDVIVVPHVLRHHVTGVAKRELVGNPLFGPLMRFLGVTFVDRAHPEAAIAALAPCVETLRGGTSLAIAPEGHRSLSPRLLPFKKGAFHLAMQAGVPIVPLVIRNAGELMWRDALTVRPGVVDVAVLDPIDVADWTPETLDKHVADVRELFARTLTHWPAPR